jgi:hypothetical protein
VTEQYLVTEEYRLTGDTSLIYASKTKPIAGACRHGGVEEAYYPAPSLRAIIHYV